MLELMRPKTTKTPPTMAHTPMMKREKSAFDFVIDIETGENSKMNMTMLSSGWCSAGFLLRVSA